MKLAQTFFAVALIAIAGTLVAQDKTCKKCPNATGAATAKVSTSACCQDKAACTNCKGECKTQCSGCFVSTAMAKLPKMTFMVGKEATCCPTAAADLAKKNNAKVKYVVGKASFDSKNEAFVSLVDSTEKFVNEFVTPKKCEVSGTTTVAGEKCGCCVAAAQRTELVSKAVNELKMTYKVGKEATCCSKSAGELAKKSGEKITYVVNKEETCCSTTARLNLARAKYMAVVKALAASQKPAATTEKTETKSGT